MKHIIKFITMAILLILIFSCTKNTVNSVDNHDQGERILFIRNKQKISEICTMRPDGTDIRVISHFKSDDYIKQCYSEAKWSPDKSKILVVGGPETAMEWAPIWIMDNDGNFLYKLTWNGGNAIWSPDGEKIIFSRRKGYFSLINDLYIIDSNGQNERILIETEDRSRFSTDWTEDGNEILITEIYYYLNSSGKLDCDQSEIAIINITTMGIEYITQNNVQDYLPEWSPDESKIVYVSGNHYSKCDIYIMDLATRVKTNITQDPAYYQYPIWSPGGDSIVYTKRSDDSCDDIFVLNLITGEIKQLTKSKLYSWKHYRAVDWK